MVAQSANLLQQREAIFSAMPNGVLLIDLDGRIHLLNEQLAREFGYQRHELLGKDVEILVPERFRSHHASLRKTFTADPSPRPMGAGRDLFGLRKDGSEFPVEIGLNPFTDENRQMVLAIVINIAERKRAEKAAADSAARRAALYKLSDRLLSAESLTTAYDAALDAMLDALHCDRASILLRDDAGVMRFVGWRSLSEDYRRAVDGHSPWSGKEPGPEPIYVPDIAAADIDEALKAAIEGEGIGALAFVPLIANSGLIGKLMIYYNVPHVFGEEEHELSLAIARQLVLSIERKKAEESLRESEQRLEFAVTAGQMGAWEWDIRTGRVFWSPSLERVHGLEPGTFGGTFDDFKKDIHPSDLPQVLLEVETALKERRNYHAVYRINHPDASVRWMEAFGRLALGADGAPQRIAGICIDITNRKRAEETETLLTAELQHRTKNQFMVVQAVAQRTLRGSPVLNDAREAFVGRLLALARSNTRLTNADWSGARLSDIVNSELEVCIDRIKLNGSDEVFLTSQAAQNFGLAIHELATNAAKYGSLSKPGGEVVIGWSIVQVDGGRSLRFSWQERGGPPVVPPKRKGFGTSLLESTLGKGRIEYKSDGLVYEIEAPLSDIT